MIKLFFKVFILTIMCWVFSYSQEDSTYTFEKIKYKQIDSTALYLHVFRPVVKTENPRPAVVFFFGGGWVNGNPSQFYEHCKYFTSRGLVCFSAEYRIKSRHGTTPFECVADGKSAVRWIRAHAAELGINPDRIVAGGGSAGGHVAACTGVIEGYEEQDENLSISSKPNALVLFNPVIDTSEKGYGQEKLRERWLEISPVHHVRKDLPSTVIFHGTSDTTVPYENVERFCDLMERTGNVCTLVAFEGKKHAFFNYGRENNENYIKTVRFADKFLRALGYLIGEPTL